MNEKPGRRLVGWKQYVATQLATAIANSIGFACILGGVAFLLLAIILLMAGSDPRLFGILGSIFFGALGAIGIWVGKIVFGETRKLKPVTPITRHNTGDLPAVETLVRASDLPPAGQQAELLRAATQGGETPPEEMLRAGTEKARVIDAAP